jgi:hypothetical protein
MMQVSRHFLTKSHAQTKRSSEQKGIMSTDDDGNLSPGAHRSIGYGVDFKCRRQRPPFSSFFAWINSDMQLTLYHACSSSTKVGETE